MPSVLASRATDPNGFFSGAKRVAPEEQDAGDDRERE